MPYDAQPGRAAGGAANGPGTLRFGATSERPQIDHPSTKYRDIEMPNAVTMQRAASPTKPTLPRRSEPKTWRATTRDRYPLTASLTGARHGTKHSTAPCRW